MLNMTEEEVLLGGLWTRSSLSCMTSPEARGYRRLSPPPYETTVELAKKKKKEENRSSLTGLFIDRLGSRSFYDRRQLYCKER
jgi:hypothetical protein